MHTCPCAPITAVPSMSPHPLFRIHPTHADGAIVAFILRTWCSEADKHSQKKRMGDQYQLWIHRATHAAHSGLAASVVCVCLRSSRIQSCLCLGMSVSR